MPNSNFGAAHFLHQFSIRRARVSAGAVRRRWVFSANAQPNQFDDPHLGHAPRNRPRRTLVNGRRIRVAGWDAAKAFQRSVRLPDSCQFRQRRFMRMFHHAYVTINHPSPVSGMQRGDDIHRASAIGDQNSMNSIRPKPLSAIFRRGDQFGPRLHRHGPAVRIQIVEKKPNRICPRQDPPAPVALSLSARSRRGSPISYARCWTCFSLRRNPRSARHYGSGYER